MPLQDAAIENGPQDSKKLIVFNHIPKCGGSTLTQLLNSIFPAHVSVQSPGHSVWAAARIDAFPQDVALATGHYIWGIEDVLRVQRTPFYITMLREPFSLFRSFYTYQVKRYNTTLDCDDYLRTLYRHNPLCEFLGGGDGELAKQRLEQYAAFGIMEEYGLSLALFAERLGFTVRDYETRNVSNSREAWLDAGIEGEFRRHNALDLDLYAWALERFRRETRTTVAVAAAVRAEAPREVKRQHVSYVAEASRDMAEGRHQDAIDQITQHKIRLDGTTMARLHLQAGDMAGFKRSLLDQWKLRRISASNLAFELKVMHPAAPERILAREIARYRGLPSAAPDSWHRRYLMECYRVLGLVRQMQGRPHAQIEAAFEASLAVGWKDPALTLNYAHYLVEAGRPRRAVQVLAQSPLHIVSQEYLGRYYGLLGDCHARLGESDKALSCYGSAFAARPREETLLRFLGAMYEGGRLAELARALGSLVRGQEAALDLDVLAPWYLLLLMGWIDRGEAARFEQGREELFLLCAKARPGLQQVSDDLLGAFAAALLEAGRRSDLMAVLTIFLWSCAPARRAGIQMLLGELHLLAGYGGPAVELFQEAWAAEPAKARDVQRLVEYARKKGSPVLADKIAAAARGKATEAGVRQTPAAAGADQEQRLAG